MSHLIPNLLRAVAEPGDVRYVDLVGEIPLQGHIRQTLRYPMLSISSLAQPALAQVPFMLVCVLA
jgi:hypothetical protein